MPSNYIFPVNTFAIGGRQTITKDTVGTQGGAWPCGPLPMPLQLEQWILAASVALAGVGDWREL